LHDGGPHAELVIVADHDDEGARHVASVMAKLAAAGAPLDRVRLVQPRVGKDAADHFAAGHGLGDFEPFTLADAAPLESRVVDAIAPRPTRDVAMVEPDDAGVPAQFFAEDGLVVPRLGDAIERLGHVRGGIDGRLYRYAHGVYLGDGDSFVRVAARRLLGDRFKRRHVDEVIAYLRASYHEVSDVQPEGVLNVANGLLEWRSGPTLIPHTPDVVSTIQIPVAWNPGARCPRIFSFVEGTLGDAAELVFELIGYALLPANPMRAAVLLLGPGRNGKSVLLHIIKALLGSENTSAVPLQLLAEHRFAAAELFGKLANICGDLDARAVRQTDIFKMLTGGDPMMGERKHRDPFKFTPFALPLFSANEPPLSSDQTEAWFDRWIVVPMERRIPEDEIDPHLVAKLTTRDELEGLLILAVDGLRKLMERGRFELPDSVRAARLAYRERLDSVAGFVAEQCELSPQAWTARPVMYRAYRSWATDSGRLPVSAATFNDHLRRGYEGKAEERTRNGARGWAGIWLREGSHDA
jgi:putative DNA primase/helicase